MKSPRIGLLLLLLPVHLISADNSCNCVERGQGILAAKKEITAELGRSNAKDWGAWFAQLEPFRAELAAKVEAANLPRRPGWPLLRASGSPPLFMEAYLANYVLAKGHTSAAESSAADTLDEFVQSRPSTPIIIGFDRWLKSRGIDLIVVPVPRMIEVYPDRVVSKTPPNRIVAPHMRKLFLDLLNADVEVVDLLPTFLQTASDGPTLYLSVDPHWSGRAQDLTAAMIAGRLRRYPFVRQALSQKPVFAARDIDMNFDGGDFRGLDDTERAEVKDANHIRLTQLSWPDGRIFAEPERSPVLVIGDSFSHYFQEYVAKGTGVDALLSRNINLAVSNISGGGATTEPIADILRDPEQQSAIKVVVWIITEDGLTDTSAPNYPKWLPIRFP